MPLQAANPFTSHVLLVRPAKFYGNPQTAEDNHFQVLSTGTEHSSEAAIEFDNLANALNDAGIKTTVIRISDELDTPDAVFPNNWFSTHRDGSLVLYPMKHPNRRTERRDSIIRQLQRSASATIDLTGHEVTGDFLEGTGSLVLDRLNRIAYAAISERTERELATNWCNRMDYRPCFFSAMDRQHRPVYHTNVVLNIGFGFAMVAAENIYDDAERASVVRQLATGNRDILLLTPEQLHAFAGNGLQLIDQQGHPVFVLSATGWNSLNADQRQSIMDKTAVLTPELSVIERIGGGSARCMMAEIFFQK